MESTNSYATVGELGLSPSSQTGEGAVAPTYSVVSSILLGRVLRMRYRPYGTRLATSRER